MLTKLISLLFAFVAFLSSTFSPIISPVKEPLNGGVRVSYGENYEQIYDIYVPEDASGEVDVIFAIHGGGWVSHNLTQYDEKLKRACDEYGYVAVGMDYRKIQDNATVSDMLEDVDAAVSSVKAYLEERGLHPDKMVLAGHSSGAQLSTVYAYTHYESSPIKIGFLATASCPASFFDSNTEKYPPVKALACGLISVLTHENVNLLNLEKKQDTVNSISALSMVSENVPPTLIIHGKKDKSVSYENALKLEKLLRENNVDCELITYENSGHELKEDAAEMDEVMRTEFYRFASLYL